MIQIFVDSTCDMPDVWLKQFNIKVLPLIVTLEGKDYKDGTEIKLEDLYDSMRKGIVPGTSQVPYEILLESFTACLEEEKDVMYISFSSKLSGTYNLAFTIMQELKEQYKERQIGLIDSKGGSFATGLIVYELCKKADEGMPFVQLMELAEQMIDKIEHLFTISGLDWLSKGGRISRPLGYIGDLLNIKPILDVEDGKMVVIKMVRGRKKALKELVDLLVERIDGFENQIIGITHAGDEETAVLVKEMITQRLSCNNILICQIGSVLGVHLGIGGVGVFFFRG